MKPRFNWRHQYDDDRDKREGQLAILRCEDESLTVQSFAPDADLNVIAKRFGISAIPTSPLDPASFRDTTRDPDLRDILETQRIARDHFLRLPAKLRKRFHNNPAELWDFVNDPENGEEAVRLGLLKKTEETTRSSAGAAAAAPPPPQSSGTPSSTGPANTGGPSNGPPGTPPKGDT